MKQFAYIISGFNSKLYRLLCFFALVVILCIIITIISSCKTNKSDKKPNFIFILADDMGWGDLGCYGHPYAKTPNLDNMASEGILFTQFYVTTPECAPSRSAFITGRVPCKAGKPHNNAEKLDPHLPNIANLLKSVGYISGHFGKWHLADKFDIPSNDEIKRYGFDVANIDNDVDHEASERIVGNAIRFIEENRDRPFYINIWLLWPHGPINPSPEQVSIYEDLTFNPYDFTATTAERYRLQTDNEMEASMKQYLACISNIDAVVGQLMDKLNELGIAERTILFFTSDNGPPATRFSRTLLHSESLQELEGEQKTKTTSPGNMGEFTGGKWFFREGGIRMPCLVLWKGKIKKGQVSDFIWYACDWTPTVCAMAGIDSDEQYFDGQDVSDVFLGTRRSRNEPIYWGWFTKYVIREGKWKLYYLEQSQQFHLYDVINDPAEENDLVESKPEQAEKLKKKLLGWINDEQVN